MTTLLAITSDVNSTDSTDSVKNAPIKIKRTRKVRPNANLSNDSTDSVNSTDSTTREFGDVLPEHRHVDETTQRKDDILHATQAEQGKLDAYKSAETELVDLIVSTVDPKDALKKYWKVGKSTHALAMRRLKSLADGAWNGRKDFDKVCDDVATLVKMRVAVKDVRPSVYVRVFLFVEACKSIVPNVHAISYHAIANKLLPTLQFDATTLTGEIKKEWLTFVRLTCENLLSDKPMTMGELDKAIDERTDEIERERKANSKLSAEQQLENELKAANRKKVAERETSQSKILKSVHDSLIDGLADVNDVVAVVKKAIGASNIEHERGIVVIDASKISADDCKSLAFVMCSEGKVAEMTYLRDTLSSMLASMQSAMLKAAI